MDIIIGSDHGGFDLKETVKSTLEASQEYRLTDIGVFGRQSSDYPIIAHQMAQALLRGEFGRGILICGSGIGMSITANRYERIRAALCHNLYAAKMSRLHNDANILVMGGRVTGIDLSLEIVNVFLSTEFEGGRHQRRVDQIER
jgi:ribose 5-phosphate isomerase B